MSPRAPISLPKGAPKNAPSLSRGGVFRLLCLPLLLDIGALVSLRSRLTGQTARRSRAPQRSPRRVLPSVLLFVWVILSTHNLSAQEPESEPPPPCDSQSQTCGPHGAEVPSQKLRFDPSLNTELTTHLKNPVYRFCQDEKYRLYREEKLVLCQDLAAFGERCPGLKGACNRPAWEEDYENTERESLDWLDFDGAWLALLVKILFWSALAFGLVLVARALSKHLGGRTKEDHLKKDPVVMDTSNESASDQEDLPVHLLLELAKQRLSEGRIHEALHLSYRATVQALGGLGLVRPHRSLTSGDYLRVLRTPPQAPDESMSKPRVPNEAFEAHLLELDEARFGSTPNMAGATALLERTRELVSRGLQLVLFVCTLGTAGCEPDGSPEPPQAKGAPRGHQLMFDLLKERTERVSRRILPVTELSDDTFTVVALDPTLKESEWAVLKSWTESGGHLVIAGGNEGFEDVFERSTDRKPCVGAITAPDLRLLTITTSSAYAASDAGESLAMCGKQPFAKSDTYGDGWLTMVADPQFFENASLAAAQNSSLALYFIGEIDGNVEFLGPWTGSGASHPIATLVRAGFDFWVLHLLGLGGLFVWAQGRRPGTPICEPEEERRAFTEHARALSRRYEKAKATGWALERYANWTLEVLRRRVPSGRADLRSVCRSVTKSPKAAAALREALTTGRKASELGGSNSSHQNTFRKLKSALLGAGELSYRKGDKD
jgi:hypothetical protein